MRFFDKFAETVVTRNHLPHGQQVGATYFVTWCLKDSVPRNRIIRDWDHLFRVARYIRRNPEKAKIREWEFELR